MSEEREPPQERSDLDISASASSGGLSLKAKGAGLFVLIALDIAGIIIVGYGMTKPDAGVGGYLALMFLLWLGYELIATLDATLGISRRGS